MLVYLFIIYIKDLFKFPLVRDVAIIVSFSYPSCDITTFLFINACLTRDLFREPEADF